MKPDSLFSVSHYFKIFRIKKLVNGFSAELLGLMLPKTSLSCSLRGLKKPLAFMFILISPMAV